MLQQHACSHAGAGDGGSALTLQLQQRGQHPPVADPHHLVPLQPHSWQQPQPPYEPAQFPLSAVQHAARAAAPAVCTGLPPRHPPAIWAGAGAARAEGVASRQPLAELLVPVQPAPAGLAELLALAQPQGVPRNTSAPVAMPAAVRPAPAWSAVLPLGRPAAPPSGGSASSSAFASCDSQEEAWETHSFGEQGMR